MTTVTQPALSGHPAEVERAPSRYGLVFNPAAGAASRRAVERVGERLRAAGREVAVFPTSAEYRGAERAEAAIAEGCDAVVACGGDGTVNETLQAAVASGG